MVMDTTNKMARMERNGRICDTLLKVESRLADGFNVRESER